MPEETDRIDNSDLETKRPGNEKHTLEPVLRLESVTRDFFDGKTMRTVISIDELDIFKGELTIIAGPSGSGKTTLLTIMGLVLKPTTGRIIIQGEDVKGYSEDRLATLRLKYFGFVFQQAALIPALSVTENLLVSRGIQGSGIPDSLRRDVVLILNDLGLAEFKEAKPQRLSTGQQQRVGIARALIGDPLLLLCDEPTSALDVESSRVVLDTLKGISQREDRGVVLITHDPRVFPYADRLIKLEDGVITYDTRGEAGGGLADHETS
jgi:putative ABC transport system ATP-binding protein